jgi:periplasmic divalent cation tolerance protein
MLLVLTTCGTAEDADSLATLLVDQRLAACVNAVAGVVSTYRWHDRVQRDQEVLLVIKTTETRLAAVEQLIRAQAKYDLPEVVALPVTGGSAPYLKWLQESVAESGD